MDRNAIQKFTGGQLRLDEETWRNGVDGEGHKGDWDFIGCHGEYFAIRVSGEVGLLAEFRSY